jgi:hypothetical protein
MVQPQVAVGYLPACHIQEECPTVIHIHRRQNTDVRKMEAKDIFIELRMLSSWMLRHAAVVRTDVSEERVTSFIRVTRISELGTTLAVTS